MVYGFVVSVECELLRERGRVILPCQHEEMDWCVMAQYQTDERNTPDSIGKLGCTDTVEMGGGAAERGNLMRLCRHANRNTEHNYINEYA